MPKRLSCVLLAASMLPLLAACSSEATRVQGREDYNDPSGRTQTLRATGGIDRGFLLFGVDRTGQQGGGSGLNVNAFLWRATLDTLSFMPLASADPFGGTIITDWHSPAGAPGERFRAQAYVLGRQLRSDGVRVQVFRQVLQGGQWIDAPVSAATNSELEDKVLARARELRSQSASR